MPVGPYKTFRECVDAQKRKGKSEEAARRICGAIEKKSKGDEEDFSSPSPLENDRDSLDLGLEL